MVLAFVPAQPQIENALMIPQVARRSALEEHCHPQKDT